jgi:LysM repeat protein
MLPPVEPIQTVVAAEIENEIAEEAAVLQAQESIKSEEDEKALLEETRTQEEAERAERELIKQQIKKRDEERRRRYVVKERDTLESIAIKQFKDVRLSKLIYEINKHLLPLRMVRGKQVRELKPRMVIFLPTNAEIEKFRQTAGMTLDLLQAQELLNMQDRSAHSTADAILDLKVNATAGDATPPNVQSSPEETAETSSPDDSQEAESQSVATVSEPVALATAQVEVAQESPPEIPAAVKTDEDDDHVGYTVRLGDTLKSIAIRQPQLLDHSLWVLLAEVNGLSTAVDTSGSPTCKLARGMRLKLPNKSEVDAFRAEKKNPFERL